MLISGRADHVAYIDCCYCDIYKACYYYIGVRGGIWQSD